MSEAFWNSRRTIKLIEAWSFWVGIFFFFLCAIAGFFGSNSLGNFISGIAFVIGLVFEIVSRACDSRSETLVEIETEKNEKSHQSALTELRTDAAESAMTTEFASIALSDRTLADDAKERIREKLVGYKGQKFQIRVRVENDEGSRFAEYIASALRISGWKGIVMTEVSLRIFEMAPGVAIWCNDLCVNPLPSDSPVIRSLVEAKQALESSLRDNGVKIANQSFRDPRAPIPELTIEIFVGPKPVP